MQHDARRRLAVRIGDLDGEALRAEVAHEPAAHVTAAADHEHATPTALSGRRDRVLLLHRQRAADQREDQLLAELRGQAVLDRGGARALDDVALLAVVTRRDAGVALGLPDLLRDSLPTRDEREDVAIDLAELGAQGVQTVAGVIRHPARLRQLARGARGSGPAGRAGASGAGTGTRRSPRRTMRSAITGCCATLSSVAPNSRQRLPTTPSYDWRYVDALSISMRQPRHEVTPDHAVRERRTLHDVHPAERLGGAAEAAGSSGTAAGRRPRPAATPSAIRSCARKRSARALPEVDHQLERRRHRERRLERRLEAVDPHQDTACSASRSQSCAEQHVEVRVGVRVVDPGLLVQAARSSTTAPIGIAVLQFTYSGEWIGMSRSQTSRRWSTHAHAEHGR